MKSPSQSDNSQAGDPSLASAAAVNLTQLLSIDTSASAPPPAATAAAALAAAETGAPKQVNSSLAAWPQSAGIMLAPRPHAFGAGGGATPATFPAFASPAMDAIPPALAHLGTKMASRISTAWRSHEPVLDSRDFTAQSSSGSFGGGGAVRSSTLSPTLAEVRGKFEAAKFAIFRSNTPQPTATSDWQLADGTVPIRHAAAHEHGREHDRDIRIEALGDDHGAASSAEVTGLLDPPRLSSSAAAAVEEMQVSENIPLNADSVAPRTTPQEQMRGKTSSTGGDLGDSSSRMQLKDSSTGLGNYELDVCAAAAPTHLSGSESASSDINAAASATAIQEAVDAAVTDACVSVSAEAALVGPSGSEMMIITYVTDAVNLRLSKEKDSLNAAVIAAEDAAQIEQVAEDDDMGCSRLDPSEPTTSLMASTELIVSSTAVS